MAYIFNVFENTEIFHNLTKEDVDSAETLVLRPQLPNYRILTTSDVASASRPLNCLRLLRGRLQPSHDPWRAWESQLPDLMSFRTKQKRLRQCLTSPPLFWNWIGIPLIDFNERLNTWDPQFQACLTPGGILLVLLWNEFVPYDTNVITEIITLHEV
jgi:hypothetical protein